MSKVFQYLMLTYIVLYVQDAASQNIFLGIWQPNNGKSYYCRDGQYEVKQVASYNEYKEATNTFYTSHPNEWAYPYFIAKDNFLLVYEYEHKNTAFNCTQKKIGYVQAATEQQAYEILSKRQQEYAADYATAPKVVYANKKNDIPASMQTVEKWYGKLYAKYRFSEKAFLAQFTNNHKDSTAVIVIRSEEKATNIFTLQPGSGNTIKLERNSTYDIKVAFCKKTDEEDPATWIDKVKDIIKEQVSSKDGKIKAAEHASMGERQ